MWPQVPDYYFKYSQASEIANVLLNMHLGGRQSGDQKHKGNDTQKFALTSFFGELTRS